MPSEVVGASIPAELSPLWDRMCEAHGGPSRFIQWVLATLSPLEAEGLEGRAAGLKVAALRARLRFLEAEAEANEAERDVLASQISAMPLEERPAVTAEAWWEASARRWGERWLVDAGERQVRALAERAGADPDACAALVARKRSAADERFLHRVHAQVPGRN